jgi:4'-phosphopantetheinyl transferase
MQRRPDLRELLSEDEIGRADQFRLAEPARRFVATRAALRVVLGQYLCMLPHEIQFSVDANKKPRLAVVHSDSDLRFNVSHSGASGILAVTLGNEIGVDIERLREIKYADQIARRYFHSSEIAAICSSALANRDSTFLRCWTAKEAVVKAIGTGITDTLDSFEVPTAAAFDCQVDLGQANNKGHCWLTRLVPHRDYVAAVAVLNSRPQVFCHAFSF